MEGGYIATQLVVWSLSKKKKKKKNCCLEDIREVRVPFLFLNIFGEVLFFIFYFLFFLKKKIENWDISKTVHMSMCIFYIHHKRILNPV
jgi:Ca2+/Na+ antiporter